MNLTQVLEGRGCAMARIVSLAPIASFLQSEGGYSEVERIRWGQEWVNSINTYLTKASHIDVLQFEEEVRKEDIS